MKARPSTSIPAIALFSALAFQVQGQEKVGSVRTVSVDVDGHQVASRVSGEGAPTVLFVGGFNAPQEYWGEIPEKVGSRTTAVTFDRAGTGASEEGPPPRHAGRVAAEMMTLLEGLGAPEPYVVVGHSFGCIFARVFAGMHADKVAALILLDPGHRDFLDAFGSRLEGEERQGWEEYWREIWSRYDGRTDGLGLEMQVLDTSLRMEREATLDENLPLVVVSALDPDRASPAVAGLSEENRRAYFEHVKEHHDRIAASTRNGRRVTAEGSGHMIPIEGPGFVIDLVLEMLDVVVGKPPAE